MGRKLISATSGEIPYTSALPIALQEHQLAQASVEGGSWAHGAHLHQQIGPGIPVQCLHYRFLENDKVHRIEARPLLALQFILSNSFYGEWYGLGHRIDHEGTCTLFYQPQVDQWLHGRKGRTYSKVELCFEAYQLRPVVSHFPLLDKLLQQVDSGYPSVLHTTNLPATNEMLDGVHELLYNPYRQEVRRLYAEAKCMELLIRALEAFEQHSPGKSPRLTPYESEQIYEASDLLLSNIEASFSLAGIARQVGTNKFKLNHGFREIYGLTVFEFLLRARMEKAQALLTKTNESIESIAYQAGYNDLYGFSKAFKKHFGTSPRQYRKSLSST